MRTPITIFVAVVAVAVGVFAGHRYGRVAATETAAKLQQEKDALVREKLQATDALEAREEDLERVRAENASLVADLDALRRDLAQLSASVTPVEDLGVEPAEEPQATVAEENQDDRSRPWERWSRGGDREGEDLTPEEMEARRAEWAARREEFASRMRENVSDFYAGQLAQADDTTSQQRVKSMEEYSNYMMDLFQQMRSTEDEEERAALQEEMGAARETMRSLVTAHQDDMLRDLADEMGIRSDTRQDQFVTRMRETMESPFFSSPERMFGGGRRGGWGGGWGRGGGQGGQGGETSNP